MPFSLKSEQQRRETKSKERELFEKPALAKSAGWRLHQAQIFFKHCYLVPSLLCFWQGYCTLLQSLASMLWTHLGQVASNTWPWRASSRQPLPLWFTNVSSAGPQFQLVILVPDGLGQINGWCQLSGQAAIQLSQRSLPGPKPHPLDPGSLLSRSRWGLVPYLQVSNPARRAASIWAMVGSVQLKALQRSAASVFEML